ncbi:hypothetical protein BBBOND_0110630 [Babesia bigemina]|uniref:Uncharacterized protein n=1 Tax=Babesia bigemina TaxID=5866 RepID=A0A061DAM4_BABBI|nr:hypothetical protein BBBOND_0110630 [Babesia bigemina]CDR94765.1 hypothetical protein BBBOND_0110630 [Babesia bigemina]|eukprot:XP_012766951.1 hypothetical protein BBBOND_0110630 [Babesia bigemina]
MSQLGVSYRNGDDIDWQKCLGNRRCRNGTTQRNPLKSIVNSKLVEGDDVGGLDQTDDLVVAVGVRVVVRLVVSATLLLHAALLLLSLSETELLNQVGDLVGVDDVVQDGARHLQLLDTVGERDLGRGLTPRHTLNLDVLDQTQHLVEVGLHAGGLDVDDQRRLGGLALLALACLHSLHLLLHGVILVFVIVTEQVDVVGLLLLHGEGSLGEVSGGILGPGADVTEPPVDVCELRSARGVAELAEHSEIVGGGSLATGHEAVVGKVFVQLDEALAASDFAKVNLEVRHCVWQW